MAGRKKQSVLNGALILVISTMVVKIVGMLYKIPLTALIGEVGRGYFNAAYDIYTPLYAISMAGLPIAVSKLVSQNVALRRFRDARMVFKVAARIFILTGLVGTVLLLGLAYPYSNWLIRNPDAMACVVTIAPSILFCCLMSSYRGYYEGMRNMIPTAVSQVIEAVGKLILGLSLAYAVMKLGMDQFHSGTGLVFGAAVSDEASALSVIYPYSAAAAVCGVTAGTVFGYLYMVLRHKRSGDRITREELCNSPKPASTRQIGKLLISVAIPIVASSLILNVTNLIDAVTIQNRLAYAIAQNIDVVRSMFAASLAGAHTLDADIGTYLYGVYGAVLDFKNLVPTITMTLGVSAIPALSAAWAVKNMRSIKVTVESVIRVTMLIGLPAGFGMGVLAGPILTLVYGGSRPYLVAIAAPIMAMYGYFVALMAVSTPITNMLQAIGRTDVPVKAMLLGAIVKIISNYVLIGNPAVNIKGAPVGSILCYLVIVGYELFFLLRQTRVRLNILSIFVKPLLCAGMSAVAAYTGHGITLHLLSGHMAASGLLSAGTVATLISIMLAVFVYVLALLVFRALSRDDVLMLPKGEKIAKTLEKYRLMG